MENARPKNEEIKNLLYQELADLIQQGKQELSVQVNSMLTIVFWKIGTRTNKEVLQDERAAYGEETVKSIAKSLTRNFGASFSDKNLRRMMQFSTLFPDFEIVVSLTRQLSWTHIISILPLKSIEQRQFYIQQIVENKWSTRQSRKQIEQKAFERNELANLPLLDANEDLLGTFKTPCFLDFLGLKEGYLENDLEGAILKELEAFILELDAGFSFIGRQKRMIIDGEDFYLDLLFYHRKLQRLVAVELKIVKFEAAFKGQMELYLAWLNKYEKQPHENAPIGLILCGEAGSEQIELLEMTRDGIMVAEFWTELPPKSILEKKLQSLIIEAKRKNYAKTIVESIIKAQGL